MAKINYIGIAVSIATFVSLRLPWWSIRSWGAFIDVYPFGVKVWDLNTEDRLIDLLVTLDSTPLMIVGIIVVVSGILALAGSIRLPPLLIAPVVLNSSAAFIFYNLMWSAIGEMVHGPSSGTRLKPTGPWGFNVGMDLCVLSGLASVVCLILYYWKRRRPSEESSEEN